MKNSASTITKYADHIGASGSFFCLIHCILTSGILIASTAGAHMHADGQLHHHHHLDLWGIIDLSMILISGLAIHWATKPSEILVKQVMWGIYLVYALTMLGKYVGIENQITTLISYSASFALIGFHLWNLKRKHSASCNC